MSELVRELRRVADEVFPFAQAVSNTGKPEKDNNIGRATVTMRQAADLIEKQDRLLGLLREYYTMSYTPDLAPRLDELKKEIDKQIKQEETL